MIQTLQTLLLFVACLISVNAKKPRFPGSTDDKSVVFACIWSLGKFQFQCGMDDSWECNCLYEPQLVSFLKCVGNLNDDLHKDQRDHYWQQIGNYCNVLGLGENTTSGFALETLKSKVANGSKFTVDDPVPTELYTSPIELNRTVMNLYYLDLRSYFGNSEEAADQSKIMVVFMISGFVLSGLYNRFIVNTMNSALLTHKSLNKASKKAKKNWLFPVAFGKHFQPGSLLKGNKFFEILVPTKTESIVIGLYLLLNLYYCLVPMDYSFRGYYFWPSRMRKFLRHLSNRTGVIAIYQVPLLVILAGRNNPLTYFTGIPYASLIQFHKWVSRVMIFDSFIHSLIYIYISFEGNGIWYAITQKTYFRFGVFATIAACVLYVQSLYYFRSRNYEIFLYLHDSMAIVFLVGMVYHCIVVGWLDFMGLAIAFWVGDRCVRIYNIYKNVVLDCHVTLVNDTNLRLRLNFKGNASGLQKKFFPGSYVFAHFLIPGSPFSVIQNHPFCVMCSFDREDELFLYVQVKKGITQVLKQFLKQNGDSARLKVFIDGPYGTRTNLNNFDNILLVAGGTGVPGPYYHFVELIEKGKEKQRVRNIEFVWSTKTMDDLKWFANELMYLKEVDSEHVRKRIYLTREDRLPSELKSANKQTAQHKKGIMLGNEPMSEAVIESAETAPLLSNVGTVHNRNYSDCSRESDDIYEDLKKHVEFETGRPNIERIIGEYVKSANAHSSLAVVFCGPGAMCDEIRNAGTAAVEQYPGVIELFEELQLW